MSSFLRRLKYYGIGFSIGLIFVFFFFRNRGCSWLPGNRVKNSILDRVLVLSEKEQAKLTDLNFNEEDLIQVLNDGEVKFKESKKEGNPQVYIIEKEFNSKIQRFLFTLPKESFISEVIVSEKNPLGISNSSTGRAKLIHFPNDENLIFVDTTAKLNCQQELLGLIDSKLILKSMKSGGFIDFSKSDFKAEPKVVHYIGFIQKGDTIGSKSIWYQNKISISNLVLPFDNECN